VDGGAAWDEQSGPRVGLVEVRQTEQASPEPDRDRDLPTGDLASGQTEETPRRDRGGRTADSAKAAVDSEGAAEGHRPFKALSREISPPPLIGD
jgi:hypothetical protein